jgi:hypothetical protein
MEYWGSKADDGLILFSDPCHPCKNRSNSAKSSVPTFQYSLAQTVFHLNGFLTVFFYPGQMSYNFSVRRAGAGHQSLHGIGTRHSQSPLTWPRGPGFQYWNEYDDTGNCCHINS